MSTPAAQPTSREVSKRDVTPSGLTSKGRPVASACMAGRTARSEAAVSTTGKRNSSVTDGSQANKKCSSEVLEAQAVEQKRLEVQKLMTENRRRMQRMQTANAAKNQDGQSMKTSSPAMRPSEAPAMCSTQAKYTVAKPRSPSPQSRLAPARVARPSSNTAADKTKSPTGASADVTSHVGQVRKASPSRRDATPRTARPVGKTTGLEASKNAPPASFEKPKLTSSEDRTRQTSRPGLASSQRPLAVARPASPAQRRALGNTSAAANGVMSPTNATFNSAVRQRSPRGPLSRASPKCAVRSSSRGPAAKTVTNCASASVAALDGGVATSKPCQRPDAGNPPSEEDDSRGAGISTELQSLWSQPCQHGVEESQALQENDAEHGSLGVRDAPVGEDQQDGGGPHAQNLSEAIEPNDTCSHICETDQPSCGVDALEQPESNRSCVEQGDADVATVVQKVQKPEEQESSEAEHALSTNLAHNSTSDTVEVLDSLHASQEHAQENQPEDKLLDAVLLVSDAEQCQLDPDRTEQPEYPVPLDSQESAAWPGVPTSAEAVEHGIDNMQAPASDKEGVIHASDCEERLDKHQSIDSADLPCATRSSCELAKVDELDALQAYVTRLAIRFLMKRPNVE